MYLSDTHVPLHWASWYNSGVENNSALHFQVISLATFDPALNSAGGKKKFLLTINAVFSKYF